HSDRGEYRPDRAARRMGSGPRLPGDRKSTRLNSSHVKISYAVFCLKKKSVVDRKSTRLNSSHVKISYADFCLKKYRTGCSVPSPQLPRRATRRSSPCWRELPGKTRRISSSSTRETRQLGRIFYFFFIVGRPPEIHPSPATTPFAC